MSVNKGSVQFDSAIVIGAGFSGLLSAVMLSKYFKRVLVLEKDELDYSEPSYRKSLPQAHHHHVMLRKGQFVLEHYLPGFQKSLLEHGAPSLDYGRDVSLYAPAGALPKFLSDIPLYPVRRSLIDFLLLKAAQQIENIEIQHQTTVEGLLYDASRARILGLKAKHDDELIEHLAELTLDCSGRGSRLPKWLAQHGLPRPEQSQVDARLSYSSQLFELPINSLDAEPKLSQDEVKASLVQRYCMDIAASAPEQPRALGLWPVENGRWLLTMISMNGLKPPTNEPEKLEFISQMQNSALSEFVSIAKPLGAVVRHQGTANIWKHYQRLNMPAGLVVLGDANCCYNPLHGQGMSVGTSLVEALDQALAQEHSQERKEQLDIKAQEPYSSTWVRKFLQRSKWIYQQAWTVALTEDLRWSNTRSSKVAFRRLIAWSHFYVDRLILRGYKNPRVIQRCLEVTNMLRSPLALASPYMIIQALLPSRFNLGETKKLGVGVNDGEGETLSAGVSENADQSPYVVERASAQVMSYLRQYGDQSSSYFSCQSACRYFVDPRFGCIAFAPQRVGFKTVNVMPTRPLCKPADIYALLQSLESFTSSPSLLIGVDARAKNALKPYGFSHAQLGREFQYPIQKFEVAGKSKKYLRWVANFGSRGFEVKEQTWSEVDQVRVKAISNTWRQTKTFSWRELAMLTRPPVFNDEPGVRKFFCYLEGRLVGFVFFDPYYQDGEVTGYCANILRCDPSVRPHGFLDYVILCAIDKFRYEGVETISLGMAPLYGVEAEENDLPLVRGLGRFIYGNGSFVYAFKDLAYHKQRYRMTESPWYICYKNLSLLTVAIATAKACRVL